MKVHLAALEETELLALVTQRAAGSTQHTTVADPADADLILILGSYGREYRALLESEIYRRFPDRCAVYTEDDNYLPLLPGVYCSAHQDDSVRAGRVVSFAYVSRNGRYQNSYLAETAAAAPLPAAEKKYLFSFQGGSTSLLRKRLFNLKFDRPDVLIENTSTYYHWDESQPARLDRQRQYASDLTASHFVLCPRGAGVGSIRFFEVMAAGIAPVLLSDDFALPPGPAWETFLIRVPEKDMAKLPELLEARLPEAAERGRLAKVAFNEHFAVSHEFDRIVDLAAGTLRHGPPDEAWFRRRQAATIRKVELRRKLRSIARNTVLRTIKLLRIRNPFQMNDR